MLSSLPAFCRIAATLKPSFDSDIKIEVWLPASGWNGKFQGVGNGGFGGRISYGAMVTALNRGYATASTDTGHVGSPVDMSWARGHPERNLVAEVRFLSSMMRRAQIRIGTRPLSEWLRGENRFEAKRGIPPNRDASATKASSPLRTR